MTPTPEKKSEVDSANASGTQALTLRGLSNPGVLRLGVVYMQKKIFSAEQLPQNRIQSEQNNPQLLLKHRNDPFVPFRP